MMRAFWLVFWVSGLPLGLVITALDKVYDWKHAREMAKLSCMICYATGGPLCPKCSATLDLRRALNGRGAVHEDIEA